MTSPVLQEPAVDRLPQTAGRPERHHRIVIVGGGNAGIAVAARLARKVAGDEIAIIEPSEHHYYQPLWTLVGGGIVPKEQSRRDQGDLIPKGVTWIRDSVTKLVPAANRVETEGGEVVSYDRLVVAPGIRPDWGAIKGLEGEVGRNGICSNYGYDYCEQTWEAIRSFEGGTAIFTMPASPIKCPGAPQKITYLADEQFRRAGVRDESRIIYASGLPGIFGVEEFAATLRKVVERKQIETRFRHELIEVRPDVKEAVLLDLESGEQVTLNYDLLNVTPPQSPPDFVKQSPLVSEDGWLDVDKHTLQNPDYPDVFALGDASSLPTSRTGAAIRKEAPVLVHNLLATLEGENASNSFISYDGYAACPLVTGRGKVVLAEFDYTKKPTPSFPFDTTKERWSMYQLKRRVLPFLYWHGFLKGRA